MTLPDYEKLLQSANPTLRIKRAGWGAMGLYAGKTYICRISSREITPYDVYRWETGKDINQERGFNALGLYRWPRLLHRGRRSVAEVLYERKLITHTDISRLS